MAFGWIGSTTAFGDVVEKTIDLMRPRHRLRLRATITVERRPHASEGFPDLFDNLVRAGQK